MENMQKANRALLTRIFERMAQGDMRALSEAMAQDFRWIFPGSWSWAGTWESREAVVHGLLRPLMSQLDHTYRMSADFVLADGDRVVVQATGNGTTTAGQAYPQKYCFVFRVTEGKLTEVIEHCDTALVERVLTPPTR
ncbi:nuclear transport factor 2 family protein [Nocardia sp. NPDC057668]|uniref:nuclear transport factor 2 family protein n=1 Tax=Nocardia sp. NPDC057668 TaxID=3346202 RepID=UPI00366E6169